MQADHMPNPQRFEVFTQIPNGKGFKIKNSKYIYFFDKNGGWYDQYNNYYNCDGQHDDPPSDEDDDFERVLLQDEFLGGDYDDYYDREYGGHSNQDHDFDDIHHHNNEHQKTLQAIALNLTILHEYPVKTPLRVEFQNMSFKATKQQILKHYQTRIGNGILNIIMTQDHGKFTGEGFVICKDVSVAQKLIRYEGEEFLGRKVYLNVESVQNNLAQPVSKSEMNIAINEDDFDSLVKQKPAQLKDESKYTKKKYLSKTQITENQNKQQHMKQFSQETKTQQPKKQMKVQQKAGQEKPQQPKKEQKQEPTWSKYLGEVTMFPKKTSFKDWMSSLGFKQNEHFKNPEKTESKDPTKRFATVELRSDVYEKIEGVSYENKKVHFEKLN